MQIMQLSFFLTFVQGQGLKTYDVTFPVFFKFVLSQGWKAGGPTSSKISLFTRSSVWKPRALDFDIKPDYHHCKRWVAESKVLRICFSNHSVAKKGGTSLRFSTILYIYYIYVCVGSRENPLHPSRALSLSRVLWKSAYWRSNMNPKSIPKQARKWIEELFCRFQVLRQHFMFLSCCIHLHAFSFIFLSFACIFLSFCIHVLSFPF